MVRTCVSLRIQVLQSPLNCMIVVAPPTYPIVSPSTQALLSLPKYSTSDEPQGLHSRSRALVTSERHGCQVRCTFEQPLGSWLHSNALAFMYCMVQAFCTTDTLKASISIRVHESPLNGTVVKCTAPLDNVAVCIRVPWDQDIHALLGCQARCTSDKP